MQKLATRRAFVAVAVILSCLWLFRGTFYCRSEKSGVVDFRPRFRLSGTVDEVLEDQLYASLSTLERLHDPGNGAEWPRRIFQTSASDEMTDDMNTWKLHNPDWMYTVSFSKKCR